MEDLYGIRAEDARRLRQLLDDHTLSESSGGESTPVVPQWVRVTSSTATSGWYPALVTVPLGSGTWFDAAATVRVKCVDGSALSNGTTYMGVRTGDASDGTPQFMVPVSGSGGTSYSVFGASGSSHSTGLVPDPGSTPGTTRFLREDATFAVPSGGGGSGTGPVLTAPTITGSSSGSTITVTITDAGTSSEKDSYTLRHGTNALLPGGSSTTITGITSGTYTITGLSAGTRYIQVWAVKDGTQGNGSTVITVSTDATLLDTSAPGGWSNASGNYTGTFTTAHNPAKKILASVDFIGVFTGRGLPVMYISAAGGWLGCYWDNAGSGNNGNLISQKNIGSTYTQLNSTSATINNSVKYSFEIEFDGSTAVYRLKNAAGTIIAAYSGTIGTDLRPFLSGSVAFTYVSGTSSCTFSNLLIRQIP